MLLFLSYSLPVGVRVRACRKGGQIIADELQRKGKLVNRLADTPAGQIPGCKRIMHVKVRSSASKDCSL